MLEALGVSDRSRTVMVGDGLGTDILGADRAGIDSIWYDPGGAGLTRSVIPTWRAGSYEEILASLKRLGQLEGNFHVCPGHGETSTLDRERKVNPYLREAMAR